MDTIHPMETWSGEGETPDGGGDGGQPASITAPEAPAPEAQAAEAQASGASLDAVEAILDRVDQALARLDDGTYGRCVSCGQPIDDSRLAGDPTVTDCGGCVGETLIEVG